MERTRTISTNHATAQHPSITAFRPDTEHRSATIPAWIVDELGTAKRRGPDSEAAALRVIYLLAAETARTGEAWLRLDLDAIEATYRAAGPRAAGGLKHHGVTRRSLDRNGLLDRYLARDKHGRVKLAWRRGDVRSYKYDPRALELAALWAPSTTLRVAAAGAPAWSVMAQRKEPHRVAPARQFCARSGQSTKSFVGGFIAGRILGLLADNYPARHAYFTHDDDGKPVVRCPVREVLPHALMPLARDAIRWTGTTPARAPDDAGQELDDTRPPSHCDQIEDTKWETRDSRVPFEKGESQAAGATAPEAQAEAASPQMDQTPPPKPDQRPSAEAARDSSAPDDGPRLRTATVRAALQQAGIRRAAAYGRHPDAHRERAHLQAIAKTARTSAQLARLLELEAATLADPVFDDPIAYFAKVLRGERQTIAAGTFAGSARTLARGKASTTQSRSAFTTRRPEPTPREAALWRALADAHGDPDRLAQAAQCATDPELAAELAQAAEARRLELAAWTAYEAARTRLARQAGPLAQALDQAQHVTAHRPTASEAALAALARTVGLRWFAPGECVLILAPGAELAGRELAPVAELARIFAATTGAPSYRVTLETAHGVRFASATHTGESPHGFQLDHEPDGSSSRRAEGRDGADRPQPPLAATPGRRNGASRRRDDDAHRDPRVPATRGPGAREEGRGRGDDGRDGASQPHPARVTSRDHLARLAEQGSPTALRLLARRAH